MRAYEPAGMGLISPRMSLVLLAAWVTLQPLLGVAVFCTFLAFMLFFGAVFGGLMPELHLIDFAICCN